MTHKQRLASVHYALGVLAILACLATAAGADLTVKDLTESAVLGTGPYYQDVKDAITAFNDGDYKTALARLQNAKKLTPALAPAEVMLAQLYFDAHQPLPGNAMLEMAIKSSPQDPEAYLALLERALAEGRLTEAEMLFTTAEKIVEVFNLSPRRKQNLQQRAYTAGATIDHAQGRLDAAKAKLEALIKLDSRNAAAHEKLGQLLVAQDEMKAAYGEFKLAAEIDEKALPAELMMAMLAPDRLGAERWLNFAVKQNANDLRTQLGAANYLLKANQIERAREHANSAIKLDPDGFDSNLVAGLAARMEGDFKVAAKHLSAAHLLQPANFLVMNHLALVLVELTDPASHLQALQFAELVARENPNVPDYLAALGWINFRLDRKRDASNAFMAALKSRQVQATQSMSSEMGYYIAVLSKEQGNADEAIKTLRTALDTEQPFAYRKQAEQLLAELTKSSDDSSSASTKTGEPAP